MGKKIYIEVELNADEVNERVLKWETVDASTEHINARALE